MIVNLMCENQDVQSLMRFLGAPAEAFRESSVSASILTFEYTKTNGLFTAKYESDNEVGLIAEVPKQILYCGIPIANHDSDCNYSIEMETLEELATAEIAVNSTLYTIIQRDNSEEMHKYMLSVRNGIDRALSEKDKQEYVKRYKNFLLETFSYQLTPLDRVLRVGNPEKMKLYIEAIKEACLYEWISNEEYADLLLRRNEKRCTVLHEACRIGNHDNLSTYLREAKTVLDKKQYINLLLAPTVGDGFTPLHSVLYSGSVESLNLYLEEINELIEEGELTEVEYRVLLQKRDLRKSTPLHSAAYSNSEEIVQRFLEILKNGLQAERYKQALHTHDAKKNSPCGIGYNGEGVNKRLAEARLEISVPLFGEKNCGSRSSSYSNSPKVTVFSPAPASSHSSPKQGQNNYASNYSRTSY